MPPLVDLSKACERPLLDLTCAGNQTSFSVDYSKYVFFGKKTKSKLKERLLSPGEMQVATVSQCFCFVLQWTRCITILTASHGYY